MPYEQSINQPICDPALPVVKCLRQGGWGGGRGGQAGRVGVVRRLLQGLDQVVSVLRIYGPQGAFTYALKESGGGERGVTGSANTDCAPT